MASAEAEREMIRMKQVRYAEKHLGAIFSGTVVGVNGRGLFVELQEMYLEGFIPIDKLGMSYEFNEKAMLMRERRSGKQIKLGDQMEEQIARTNRHLWAIELALTSGKILKKAAMSIIKNIGRIRQITTTFAKYGFGELMDKLGFARFVPNRYRHRGDWDKIAPPQRLRMALEELGPTPSSLGKCSALAPIFCLKPMWMN